MYHEFGHWHDYHTRFKKFSTITSWTEIDIIGKEFNDLCAKDWANLKKIIKKKFPSQLQAFYQNIYINDKYSKFNTGDYFEDLSKRLFGKSYTDLGKRERYIVSSYADTIGSISNGLYGGGHSKSEYKYSWANGEAYAHAFSAWIRKDFNFKLDFPEIWNYIESSCK